MRASFCPNCASPLGEGDERCPSCGIELAEWLRPELMEGPDGEGSWDESAGGESLRDTASLRALESDSPAADPSPAAGGAAEGGPGAGSGQAAGIDEREDDDAESDSEASATDEAGLPLDEVLTKESPLSIRYAHRKEDEPDGWSSDHNLPLGILVVMAAVLLLVLLVMSRCGNRFKDPYLPRQGQTPGQSQPSNATGGASDGSQGQDASSDGASDDQGDEEERKLRRSLQGRYFELKSLAGKVDASEKAFDDGYEDYRKDRTAHADEANALLAQVNSAYESLLSQHVDEGSGYRSQYLLLLRCYADLVERMQIVSELWERNLQYAYPQSERETVLEPRTNRTDADGNLIPKADYDDALSQISL